MVLFDKEDSELLNAIVLAMYDELPNPKKKPKKLKYENKFHTPNKRNL